MKKLFAAAAVVLVLVGLSSVAFASDSGPREAEEDQKSCYSICRDLFPSNKDLYDACMIGCKKGRGEEVALQ